MVTGEYSRGASGFWIENGELAYPVSEVTIASNLKDMFLQHGAGQRSRPQFRHRRADAADRGHDPCRQLTRSRRTADDLALLRDAAREAGAIAMRYFRQEPGSLDEGRHFAGQRGRLRRRPLPARDADWRRGRTMAGCRRRPSTAPARLSARRTFVVDPIDGTRGFLEGRATWCVSVAVVEDGRPLAGVLECPATRRDLLGAARAAAPARTASRICGAPRRRDASRSAGRSR